jgi:hypothetical protein
MVRLDKYGRRLVVAILDSYLYIYLSIYLIIQRLDTRIENFGGDARVYGANDPSNFFPSPYDTFSSFF